MSTEQEKWLAQPQTERGFSPQEQTKRPLGFGSKREYRERSVYGYQDARHEQKLTEDMWNELDNIYGLEEDFNNCTITDVKFLEKNFKDLEYQEKRLEKLYAGLPPAETRDCFSFEIYDEDPRWHWESREMPSGKSIQVKVYQDQVYM